ncbi:hypothetical protein DFQ29_006331 [Apophysomyces sp. BC1021]|nr:hypothetical protein DFQ29_006331 [Apophysomyces sp. BC1021]
MIQQQFIHPHYENPQQTAHWTTDTNPLTSVDMKMTTTPSLCLTADKNPETRDKLKWHSTSSDSMELSQDRYIENLQKQLDDSHKAETEYKLRIQQLMDLVEKQTRKITELRDELTTCRLQNMPSTSTHNEE